MRQFIESLRRLYINGMISEEKINKLFNDSKITNDEKKYILNID